MAKENGFRTLERGNIYFFYRPKIGVEHPESESQIQRFFMVMSPDKELHYRLIVMGKKELPDTQHSGHQRY